MLAVIQDISVVAADAVVQSREILGTIALWGFAVAAAVYGGIQLTRLVRWLNVHGIVRKHRFVLVVMAFACCLYAQKKGTVTFPFTDPERKYFVDHGSYVDTNFVHLAFTKIGIPDDADFLGCVRPMGSTNDAEWVQFITSTVGEILSPTNIVYEGAISNDFEFFSTYTEGPTVHTNGVLNVKWGKPYNLATTMCEALPMQTEVRLDNLTVATPGSIWTNDAQFINEANINLLMELNDEIDAE